MPAPERHGMTTTTTAPKPNFFIVGAAKCGTTAWYEYLRQHPDIYFPDVKEPHFFSTDMEGYRQVTSASEYRSLFASAGSHKVIGEASVMYLYSTVAAEAIHAFNPDAKILILLREQEDYLPALHHQYLYNFRESIEDFEQVWRLSENRPPETIPKTCREPRLLDYAAVGRFDEQVERYLAVFPPGQVRVVYFRDWTSDPRKTYLSLLDFLGLDDDGKTDFPRINEAKAHRFKWLARMIAFRPKFTEVLIRPIRKLAGRQRLKLAARTLRLLASKGYQTKISPELRDEIRRYYEADNRRLNDRLAAIASSGKR